MIYYFRYQAVADDAKGFITKHGIVLGSDKKDALIAANISILKNSGFSIVKRDLIPVPVQKVVLLDNLINQI